MSRVKKILKWLFIVDDLYVDYYTNNIDRDWFWLIGMVSPSEIRMARVNLPALEKLAAKASGTRQGFQQIDQLVSPDVLV